MRLFTAAFLIAMNVMWFGLCQMERGDSVTPVSEWCNAASVRKELWNSPQNRRNTPYIASRNHFNPKNEKDTVSW